MVYLFADCAFTDFFQASGISPDEAAHEAQGHVADLTPAVVDDKSMPAVRHADCLGDTGVPALLPEDRVGNRRWDGVVLLARNDEQGSRSGFLELALAWVQGLMFAVAAWNNGVPDAGTANVS